MNEESPCIGICQIDQKTSYCVGCLRTIEEISRWSSFTHKEKKEIINLISKRKKCNICYFFC